MSAMKPEHVTPVPDPLPDGTLLADLQAAMQAAWIAGDRQLSAELAKRYGLYNSMCLRCAVPWLNVTTSFTGSWPDTYLARLCGPCQHEEIRPSAEPVTIIDGVSNMRVDRPLNLQPWWLERLRRVRP